MNCGKKPFRTWDEAGIALVNAKIRRMLHGRQNRREQRIYWCAICAAHHLTSAPERKTA